MTGSRIRVRHRGADVIAPSRVGLTLADRPLGVLRIKSTERHDSVRSSPTHEDVLVRAREMDGARQPVLLRLRAYDTGAAFRIELPRTAPAREVRVAGETTALRLPRGYACLDVRHADYVNSHEGDYAPVRASALQAGALYDII